MNRFTLLELNAFNAVVTEGSYQAAAKTMCRTHPTIYAAIKNLEQQLDIVLFDRSSYRAKLTDSGRAFHVKVTHLLAEVKALDEFSEQIRTGEETDLSIVIGDACPDSRVLPFLSQSIDQFPNTKFHFYHESISAPWEKLLNREVDLIIHHIDKTDVQFEYIELFPVNFIPVVSPGYLPFPINDSITPNQMLEMRQCIIRDSSKQPGSIDYFLLNGTKHCSVDTQELKNELIVSKMAWGRLPDFLIRDQLKDGRLVSIEGKHFKQNTAEIVLARLRGRIHGPVLQHLFEAARTYPWTEEL